MNLDRSYGNVWEFRPERAVSLSLQSLKMTVPIPAQPQFITSRGVRGSTLPDTHSSPTDAVSQTPRCPFRLFLHHLSGSRHQPSCPRVVSGCLRRSVVGPAGHISLVSFVCARKPSFDVPERMALVWELHDMHAHYNHAASLLKK